MKNTGLFLKQKREEKKISLEEIAVATKIKMATLIAMEEGQLDKLPQKAFLRGFVQSYSKHLGLNADEIVKMLDEELGITKADASGAIPTDTASSPVRRGAINPDEPTSQMKVVWVSVTVILFVLIVVVQRTVQKYKNESRVQTTTVEATPIDTKVSPTPSATANVDANPETDNTIAAEPSPAPSSSATSTTTTGLMSHASPAPSPSATASPATSAITTASTSASPTTSASPAASPIHATAPSPVPTYVVPATPIVLINPSATYPPHLLASPSPVATLAATQAPVLSPAPASSPAPSPAPSLSLSPIHGTTPSSTPSVTAVHSPSPTASPKPSPSPKPSTTPTPAASATPALKLNPQEIIIEALDAVNVSFTIDNDKPKSIKLAADQIRTIKANSMVTLEVSDGGAINLIHNGKDLGVPGKLGQPLKLKYP